MDAKSDILLCWQFDPINDTRRRFKVSWRSMPPHLLNIHVHTCATQAFLPVRHNYSIIPALAAVKCILHVQLRPRALLQILKGLQSRGFQWVYIGESLSQKKIIEFAFMCTEWHHELHYQMALNERQNLWEVVCGIQQLLTNNSSDNLTVNTCRLHSWCNNYILSLHWRGFPEILGNPPCRCVTLW